MLTVPEKYFENLPSDRYERLFVEAWYSLVHRESLDSYRVRCMNSVNILRELHDLITDTNFKYHEKYIKSSAYEGIKILGNDKTISDHFKNKYERVMDFIKHKLMNMSGKNKFLLIAYYLKDFIDELNLNYQDKVISEIENAIKSKSKEEEKIVTYVANLLTYLVDKGYSLNSLYALIWNFFIKDSSKESFEEKFRKMKKILSRGLSEYDITLRIKVKTKNLTNLKLDKNIEIRIISNSIAEIKVKRISAVDDRSAGIEAKRKLDSILDIIRFEVEAKAVWIEEYFFSERPDNTKKDFKFNTIIPNPIKSIGSDELESFNKKIVSIFDRDDFDEESKRKIKSALYFYRIGRDGDVLENKVLNWWTALEYMTFISESERDRKIEQVQKNITSTLVVEYIKTHLHHLRESLSYCKIPPSEDSIRTYSDIEYVKLFDIIRDQNNKADMENKTDKYLMLQYRLRQFRDNISDKNLSNFLDNHKNHVEWHINRIYRIRNAIVHNADYSMNLGLIVANLEYYLKRVILVSINVIHDNKLIKNLKELFGRIVYTNDILLSEAHEKNKNWDTIKEIIKKTVI